MGHAEALVALADPTRRAAFELLRGGPLAVGEIAERMPVSRPAVSQHLRVLKDAGLVNERRAGTRRLYAVEPDGVAELRAYLDDMWTSALDSFELAANKQAARSRRAGKGGRK